MRRKHKKGVVSSVYDYIFFLHPSSCDPRATILLVSDAGCLTKYKRARYSRAILKLAFACSIIHMTRTYLGTHICIICTQKTTVYVVSLYPVRGCGRAERKLLCPPSVFKTIILAMKECFQSNQLSLWIHGGIKNSDMLNLLAKHQWAGEDFG